jgi:hypothetical protein
MRVVARSTEDRRFRGPSPAPPAFERSTAIAAVLATVGLIGLVVIVAAAFFKLMGLVFAPDHWLGVIGR